jgi:hypothetical protein
MTKFYSRNRKSAIELIPLFYSGRRAEVPGPAYSFLAFQKGGVFDTIG